MEAGNAAAAASGAAAASDDAMRLQRAVERLQALVVDGEEGKPVEAPALGEQLKRVKAAADRAIKGRADALRDPAVTGPLGKGLAHCLSRPQDEELCQGACNLVPTLARALTQHGSTLALVLLPLLLDRLQDGQSTASAAYTGACALVSHCYDSEGAALPPVLARMMAADAAPAAPGSLMSLPLDPHARRQLYQLLKIALEKWPVQSMRQHMPLVASCIAADVASPDPLRLEAGFKGLTYLGTKWQAEGEQIYRGMSRDKQQRFVQSHPGFRVPAAVTPRSRRSPGAMRSPSPSRLTARTTPGRSASPSASLNGRRRLSGGPNPGAGTTPTSTVAAAAGAGSGQRRSKRSPAEQQQERVRQLLLYKMRRDRGFVDAALAAPVDFSLSASEDGSTTSSLRSEGRNSVRSDSGGGYRNSAARRQEELQRRKRLMMSPTLREGIQELRPSPMGLGGLGSLAGAGLTHVGVGVGMEGVGGLGSLAGVGLAGVGMEATAPTPLQRFQQDLQAARSGSGEAKRARESEEQEDAGQEEQEQPVSAGVAMAAEALCVQEEVEEEEAEKEEEAEPVPAVLPAVPEAKEEQAAADGEKDVTPRTLARAMQQEALRIEMEANPTMVPPVLVPVAFEAEAAAMHAEQEVNPPPPPAEPQDENAGNYLANTDASPAAAASVVTSVAKPASRRGSGSGKRVSFSAEECVVIEAPPAALGSSEEEEEEEEVQPEPLLLEVDVDVDVGEAAPYEPLVEEGEVPWEVEADVGLGVVGVEEEEEYDADMEVGKDGEDDVVLEDIMEDEEEEGMKSEEEEAVVEKRAIEETKWGEHEPAQEPISSRSKDESGVGVSFASSRRLFIATTVAVAGAVLVGTAVLRKYPPSASSTAGLGVREQMQQPLGGAGWGDDLGSFSLEPEVPMPSFSSEEAAVVKPQPPPKKQQPPKQKQQSKQQAPKQEEAVAPEAKMSTPSIFQKQKKQQQEAAEGEKAAAATAPTSKAGGGRWPFLGVVKQAPATAAEPGTPVRPTAASSSSSSSAQDEEKADLQVLRVPRRSKFWGRVGEVVQRAVSFRLFGVLLALGMVFLSLA